MDTEKFFDEIIKQPLNELLIELSRSNVDHSEHRSKDKTAAIVKKILETKYFQSYAQERPLSYDCHARFRISINNNPAINFASLLPCCFSPVTNEKYFYCRGNLTEGTKSRYDEVIPSRDYSSHSYEWKNLYSAEHAEEALELISKELSGQPHKYKKHRIHLFGFLKDQQRSYTQLLSTRALAELCSEASKFRQMCESEEFEFFALSLGDIIQTHHPTGKDNILPPENVIEKKNETLDINNKSPKPITYVIFIDSLDSSIFDNQEFLAKLPALKELHKKSLFFKNFTSSGFWTFPCLHSSQTGIHPKYSSSFLKLDPAIRRLYEKKLVEEPINLFDVFCFSSYALSEIKINSLTHIIRQAGMKTASIKSSSVNSHYWNLQEGVDVSIENSTIDLIPHHLKKIKDQFNQDVSTIFIDIDTLHRGPLFYKDEGVDWGVDEISFINRKQSKKNRLLGIKDTSFNELTMEMSQLKKVDIILGELLQQVAEQDNIVLFSDNGSQNQPSTISHNINFIQGSSGTIEKIWRPTLLVKSNKYPQKSGTQHELVSTSDIFPIVLDASGISSNVDYESKYFDGMLPLSLGGSNPREVAETFGINYENPSIMEWCKRYNHTEGDYRTINMMGRRVKPIDELIYDFELLFQTSS